LNRDAEAASRSKAAWIHDLLSLSGCRLRYLVMLVMVLLAKARGWAGVFYVCSRRC
jgi:hypothetical protein